MCPKRLQAKGGGGSKLFRSLDDPSRSGSGVPVKTRYLLLPKKVSKGDRVWGERQKGVEVLL